MRADILLCKYLYVYNLHSINTFLYGVHYKHYTTEKWLLLLNCAKEYLFIHANQVWQYYNIWVYNVY